MGKSQSKYKSKPHTSGNFTNEEKLEDQEPSPSTSACVSNVQQEPPVDVTNIATSEKLEGRRNIIVLHVI